MEINSKPQAKALRELIIVLERCLKTPFFKSPGDLAANISIWWTERNAELMAARNAALRSGCNLPDDLLLIPVPRYGITKDKYTATLVGSIDPKIQSVIEQVGLALMRWDAVHPFVAESRDPRKEARDKWIYEECCNFTVYTAIIDELDQLTDWERIDTPQGIREAAISYALRLGLPPIPKRKRGRKRKSN